MKAIFGKTSIGRFIVSTFLTLVACGMGLFTLSCRKHKDNIYYRICGTGGWNAVWFVNEQPAYIGYDWSGGYIKDVSMFITNGVNTLRCKAVCTVADGFLHDFKLLKAPFNNPTVLWESAKFDQSATDIDKTVKFKARTTNTWAWTGGDLLTETDKKDVAQIVSQLYDFLVSITNQTTLISEMEEGTVAWASDANPSLKRYIASFALPILRNHQEPFEFSIVETNNVKVMFGTKVALLYADSANLLSSKPIGDSEGTFSIAVPYAYFFRKEGEWIMLENH